MSERGLICCAESVRAFLDGRKTQTRRIIKMPEGIAAKYEYKGDDGGNELLPKQSGHYWMNGYAMWRPKHCPDKVGDLLWVRETFAKDDENNVWYRADKCDMPLAHGKWRPSRFMPKWAARIWLEITNIRVERVQDMTELDAIAEGCPAIGCDEDMSEVLEWFTDFWDSLNEKRGFGWEKNPWVWVLEVKMAAKAKIGNECG